MKHLVHVVTREEVIR